MPWMPGAMAASGTGDADKNQSISATFDTARLQAAYQLSCADQTKMRVANIPPPHFPGRPAAFANPDQALVIYSPHFTPAQRALAEKLYASVPAYALPLAYRGGAVYVFPRRTIVEAVPALAVEEEWFSDYGLYMAVEKRLYLPFERGVNITRQADGTYTAMRYESSQREPFRIVNHETGHLIDAMLGGYSRDSAGADGDHRLSNRADYQQALRQDLAAVLKRNLTRAQIQRRGYYLPYEYEGIIYGGMQRSEQRTRREVFAELWAEVHGYDSNKLSATYPRTFAVVKNIAAFLKSQHDSAPHHCL
ncbi:MAG TPA: hypothetical protein VGD95_00355 [Micavibrio sp.]